jgi:hypothetical protein
MSTQPANLSLAPSPFDHLVVCGYSTEDHDEEGQSPVAFAALMSRVFSRLLALPGEPLWLGVVEVSSPGSSAWLDAFGDAVIVLEEGANWWPGTERLSPGDVRVRAIPVEAFGKDWSRIEALVGEGLYSAFDPFLFSRHAAGDLCHALTVGHEGTAFCVLPESDAGTLAWLESLGFSGTGAFEPATDATGKNVLCGVRTARELAEIFGE